MYVYIYIYIYIYVCVCVCVCVLIQKVKNAFYIAYNKYLLSANLRQLTSHFVSKVKTWSEYCCNLWCEKMGQR